MMTLWPRRLLSSPCLLASLFLLLPTCVARSMPSDSMAAVAVPVRRLQGVSNASAVSAAILRFQPEHIRGQLRQDEWVLKQHPSPGVYLDLGARDGETISNSYALDKHRWTGFCIEPFPSHFEGRTCTLAQEVVTNTTGDVVQFVRPALGSDPGLGGIADHLGLHKNSLIGQNGSSVVEVTTISIRDLLRKYDVPKHIAYWSLDTEGSEYDILKAFPWCEYQVQFLTVEHNFEEPKRTMMKELLEEHGLDRVREVQWDDWYVLRRPDWAAQPVKAINTELPLDKQAEAALSRPVQELCLHAPTASYSELGLVFIAGSAFSALMTYVCRHARATKCSLTRSG